MKLEDKAAIVTGATRGIGKQIAITLAEEGCDVVINGNDEEGLKAVGEAIAERGRRYQIVTGDISKPETSGRMAATCLEAFGKIDVLVNNAGVNSRFPFLELTFEEWSRMIDINLNGAFHACKAVLPHMVERRSGCIVNVSSAASKTAHANASASYGVSKAGLNSLTQKLALEMAPYGIRVNGVCPGPIETDMSLQWTDEYRSKITSKIPLGRLGATEDVARPVAFLASDEAAYITGETININGGKFIA